MQNGSVPEDLQIICKQDSTFLKVIIVILIKALLPKNDDLNFHSKGICQEPASMNSKFRHYVQAVHNYSGYLAVKFQSCILSFSEENLPRHDFLHPWQPRGIPGESRPTYQMQNWAHNSHESEWIDYTELPESTHWLQTKTDLKYLKQHSGLL